MRIIVKKHLLLFTLLLFMGFSQVGWGQIISQYVETESGTVPKAIEIWNNTGATLSFATNNLVIKQGTNGGVLTALVTISTGTLNSGSCLVIGTSTPAGLQTTTASNGGTFSAYTFTFNGDDALQVEYGGVVTDIFGTPGSDPGTSWTGNSVNTANQSIQLKVGISSGSLVSWTDPSTRFETVTTTPSTDFTGFGACTNTPLPVELTSFSALTKNKTVNLTWHTATEVNNYGFEIQKSNVKTQNSNVETQWSKVGFVNGAGNSNAAKEYNFTDRSVPTGKYLYRLKQLDNDGQYEYSKEIEVDLGMPTEFALEQNYPNPFNPSTSIQYSVVSSQNVVLKIFNVIGKEVAVLVNEKKEPGTYTVDFSAANLASGTYLYRLQTGEFVQTKKMVILK